MKVQVELTGSGSIDGLKDVLTQWEQTYPMGRLTGLNAYCGIQLILEMPPATQVVPPQITDARSYTVEP